jgi:hypothetical protein
MEATTMTTEVKPESIDPSPYRTSNRGLAAAPIALGFVLTDIEHGDHEVIFAFPGSRMLLNAADAYLLDTLSVSAARMGEAIEQLDDLISGHGMLDPDEVDWDDL